jgi:hypothetical protein
MKQKAEIVFSALLVLVFAFAVYEARGWQLHARLLPWVMGLPMLVLSLSQLVLDLRKKGPVTDESGTEVVGEIPLPIARQRAISIVLWLLGLFAAIWLLGFSISVPLFTFLYLKFDSGEDWWFAALLTALTWGFFYGLFVQLLNLPFPEGALFEGLDYR